MNESESPQELYLCGYEPLTEQGFARPIFGAAEGANTAWTADADIPGDRDARIISFTEGHRGSGVERFAADGPLRLARCGDPMTYVFLWRGRVCAGTAKELVMILADDLDAIAAELPLTALALAQYAGRDERRLAQAAARWWRSEFGVAAETAWLSNSLFRDTAIREIRRAVRNDSRSAEIVSLTTGVGVERAGRGWRMVIPEPLRDRLGDKRMYLVRRHVRSFIALLNPDSRALAARAGEVAGVAEVTRATKADRAALLAQGAQQAAMLERLLADQARGSGVDPEALRPIFEHLGHLNLSATAIRARAAEAVAAILDRARQAPAPSNDGADIAATLGTARDKLGRLDTAGALATLSGKLAEEEAARRQRMVPLLAEKAAIERLT